MASITIRNLDDRLKAKLRVRAAEHGTSMEDEAREIIRVALSEESAHAPKLASAIGRRFATLGGVELPEMGREPIRGPIDFQE